MRITVAVCFLTAVLAGDVFAQSRPDFSGQWILVHRSDLPSNIAHELTVHQTDRTTSIRGVPLNPPLTTLMIERRSGGGVATPPESYQIGVEGGLVGVVVGGSNERASRRAIASSIK